jgi:hypothetical protein
MGDINVHVVVVVVHNHYEKLDHVKLKCLCYYKYQEKTKVWEVLTSGPYQTYLVIYWHT